MTGWNETIQKMLDKSADAECDKDDRIAELLDKLAAANTLAADRAEVIAKQSALLEAYEATLREIERLGSLVAHDLQGRIEGGKLAAVARLPEIARKSLETK